MALANRFGWSVSREAVFRTCRRRYYFHYYLSWGGWDAGASALVREAFKLKRLVSLFLWRGQLVHYVASKFLQSMKAKGKIPSRDAVSAYTVERFNAQLEFSRSKRYLTTPKKSRDRLNIDWLALLEHEYGREIGSDLLAAVRSECIRGVEGLFECPLTGALAGTAPESWVIEDLDSGAFAEQFQVAGVPIFVKTDFIFRDSEGKLCIVDWKTFSGKEPTVDTKEEEPKDAAAQLGVYQYYAARVLGEPLASIRLYEVNLLQNGRVKEHAACEESFRAAERRIVEGIDELSSVLVRGDTSRNEALPPEHFPKIEDGGCRFCNFFRICRDESSPLRLP